jgi:hypothetical protein
MRGTRWWTGTAVLALTVVGIHNLTLNADDDKAKKDNQTTTKQNNDKATGVNNTAAGANNPEPIPFLGLMVEDLHPAFAKHLPGSGMKGQGLMVEDVGKDSPAGKAGIKSHDILMTYDDQKLFSHEQFVKLIHADKPGREVSLGIIREGKSQTVKVQLGQRDPNWDHHYGQSNWPHQRQFWPGNQQGIQQTSGHDNDHPAWRSFDSLTLKKLDDNRFKASVGYMDKDGKVQKHEYEGTRDEIRKKIDGDKDLMPNERFHLIRGLDLQDGNFPFFLMPDDQLFDF